jgi:Flp pilus assembly protein TadG
MKNVGRTHGRTQSGISTVIFAIALFMILAFTALAVDGGNLFVARNELQNAADAGALAGARVLYTDDGSSVNPGANAVAQATALANESQGAAVEVISVQRGHWSFATRTFTANPSLEPVDLFSATTAELDLDLNFINAVEVVTAREATPVGAFFGTVLGFDSYPMRSRAVAYIGFASSLRPEDLDQPIGLCRQQLINPDGSYHCSVGTMIPATTDTGGWTNFQQNEDGAASSNEIRDLVCDEGNPMELFYGEPMQTTNGQVQSAFQDFWDCWVEQTDRQRPWNMTLPVLDCPDGSVGPTNDLVGAVNVNVVWVVNQTPEIYDDAPTQMEMPPDDGDGVSPGTWTSGADGETRWNEFVDYFNLQDGSGNPAPMQQKTIYFLPDCSYHEPKGTTGGENYGVLARIPVLVD